MKISNNRRKTYVDNIRIHFGCIDSRSRIALTSIRSWCWVNNVVMETIVSHNWCDIIL